MPFSFTFQPPPQDLHNPFQQHRSQPQPIPITNHSHLNDSSHTWPHHSKAPLKRRPSPISLTSPQLPALPISRKRGWEPTFSESTSTATTLASSSGYLDTPAKYREMAALSNEDFHEIDPSEMPPPTKRRRGLAGSIVSTAISAALIGTAVGLTVYRLMFSSWRDRGKDGERLPPPPPYEESQWTAAVSAEHADQPQQVVHVTPATPRGRKSRPTTSSTVAKRTATQRRARVRTITYATPPPTSAAKFPQPEFDFDRREEESDMPAVEDQMDWIGDKLSALIEEGKRALGREVVVMSDAKEDEVDDGSGAWEDAQPTSSRTSSIRRTTKRPRNIIPPSFTAASSSSSHIRAVSSSPRKAAFEFAPSSSAPSTATMSALSPTFPASSSSFHTGYMPVTPRHSRGASLEALSFSSPTKEDDKAWESPELRESMEKARARLALARAARAT